MRPAFFIVFFTALISKAPTRRFHPDLANNFCQLSDACLKEKE